MPRLICITGADGTGKSTLVKKLAKTNPSVYVSNIWDIMAPERKIVLFHSKKDIDDYLCSLTADSRLLFLAHALEFSIETALKSGKEIVLINAYYYKYFATELALGAYEKLVHSVIAHFPKPDLLIRLELPVALAAERKPVFSRYECGLAKTADKEHFIAFQEKVLQQWGHFDQAGWHIVNANLSKEETFEKVIQLIDKV